MNTQNTENHPHRRRPWIAAFLSLIMPGLGHIYCGKIQSGMAIMLIVTMFSAAWLGGIMHEKTPFLPFSLMVGGILLLAVIVA
ncbi:MAG: hypothetical protein GY809_17750, partial [Planctomycetes bacterium]|nr:hypothetical protein [Planctomycetota bacterium]